MFLAVIKGLFCSFSIVVGYLPIAFSFGVSGLQSGLSPDQVILISALIFAGGSQFVLIGLLSTGGAIYGIVATVLLMNARHFLYGKAIIDRLKDGVRTVPAPLLAFGLTDEVFASAVGGMDSIAPNDREYWLIGLQLGAYLSWVVGTLIGVVAGYELLEDNWIIKDALAFILPALFLSLLLSMDWHKYAASVAISAALTAFLLLIQPVYIAILVGMLAGAFSSMIWRK